MRALARRKVNEGSVPTGTQNPHPIFKKEKFMSAYGSREIESLIAKKSSHSNRSKMLVEEGDRGRKGKMKRGRRDNKKQDKTINL